RCPNQKWPFRMSSMQGGVVPDSGPVSPRPVLIPPISAPVLRSALGAPRFGPEVLRFGPEVLHWPTGSCRWQAAGRYWLPGDEPYSFATLSRLFSDS